MRQQKIWVATFDQANCRVFTFNGAPRRLDELIEERRSGPHKPQFADRQGRVHARMGARRSAMTPRSDAERRLETAFVKSLATHLAEKAEAGAFDRLIVAATPRALGAFRSAAPQSLVAKVSREVRGDYVNAKEERLFEALDQ